MQQSRNNTYSIPTSPETTAQDQRELFEAALEAAIGTHEINSSDVDRRRIEGIGASMLAASDIEQTPSPVEFDYTDPVQLNMVAPAIMHARRAAIEESKQSGYNLAA